MKKIVLASNNQHKIKEFKEILKDYEMITLNDIGFTEDILETGNTFLENALIKAKAVHDYLQNKNLFYPVIAEDSGLCVDALNGEPGIYSHRYAGDNLTNQDQKNRNKLQKELEGKNRSAYFISTIVIYFEDNTYKSFVGTTDGEITREELGKKDFGYDCIFYSKDLKKTFGEATEEEKNAVSHRARAIKKLVKELSNFSF